MWTKRLVPLTICAAWAAPACADYTHAPFHDRPFEVAKLALAVLDDPDVPVPAHDTPLVAAVAALLLVSEIGLAEAFEEAVGGDDDDDDDEVDDALDNDGYATAYGLLKTIKPWFAAIPQSSESRDLIARLDALMPTPERPAKLDSDPEAAEVLAQALVGHLERAADADLYLGRDLARAIDTVSGLAAQGCAQATEGHEEVFHIAALYFEDSLEAPLSIMAAAPAERIEDALAQLTTATGEVSGTCQDLLAGFSDARKVMFP